jgi:hypothetical protein
VTGVIQEYASMMPFSVLRIWGLGIFGWLLLGAAVYCGWRARDEIRRDSAPILVSGTVADDTPGGERRPEADAPVIMQRPAELHISKLAWEYLAATIALMLVSFGGNWPVQWLLSNRTGPQPEQLKPTQQTVVDRPDGSRLYVAIYGNESAPTLCLASLETGIFRHLG